MPENTVRSTAPDRTARTLGVLLRALALALVLPTLSLALAQGPFDSACPPLVWCHPDGSGLSVMEDAATEVGKDLVRRREAGDCTGLGPEGCLGVVLAQFLCVIDGRKWVQEYACAPGPVAESQALTAAEHPEVGRWLRGELERANGGERFTQLRLGESATLDLIVWGRYERRRGDATTFFTVLRAIDSVDRIERLIVVGVAGDLVYVGDYERLRDGARRGTAPIPFDGALALGGPR